MDYTSLSIVGGGSFCSDEVGVVAIMEEDEQNGRERERERREGKAMDEEEKTAAAKYKVLERARARKPRQNLSFPEESFVHFGAILLILPQKFALGEAQMKCIRNRIRIQPRQE